MSICSCAGAAVATLLLAGCGPSGLGAIEALHTVIREAAGGSKDRPAEPPVVPVPSGAVSIAASEDIALQRAWIERNLIGGYRRAGRRNPRWDEAAEAFIRESTPAFMSLAVPVSADLRARAKELMQAGCDDPLVLYFQARAQFDQDPKSRGVSELFERAVAGMHDVAYPRAAARFAASGLRADFDRRQEGTGKREALSPVELGWFLASLKDGSYAPDDDVVLTIHLTTGTGVSFFQRNRAAVTSALQSTSWVDPWVRHLFSGIRQVDDAWDARGNTYAGKVKPEGWKGFSESIAGADRSLRESWRLRSERPEAAAKMIAVSMADAAPGESPRLWFDRAVATRFDYMPAYRRLVNALRTRWQGDPQALPSFARECADTRRFDTEVPLMAFEAAEQMEEDLFDEARGDQVDEAQPEGSRPPSPYRDEDLYRLVATVLERYRREPGIVRWQRYASLQAATAYKAGRYEEARKALHDLGGKLDAEAVDAVGEPLLEARIEAFASPDGDALRRAEEHYRALRADAALPIFRKARARAPAGAAPYLEQRLAAGALEADLRAGRTVRFLPGAGLAGWTSLVGTWSVEPSGALVGTSAAQGMMIAADARVGPDFELATDVEIVSTSNGQFQAGVIFGRRPSFWSYGWSAFRIKRTTHEGDVLHFSKHFTQPVHSIKHAVGMRNRILVQSWNGRLWAYLDGEPVVTDYAPEWKPPRTLEAQVGFGAYLDDNRVVVRYSDVSLRHLKAPPKPPGRNRR